MSGVDYPNQPPINWVRCQCFYTFSGGAPTLWQSYNVSSLTDLGTGDTQVNFTKNINWDLYYVPLFANMGGLAANIVIAQGTLGAGITNTQLRLITQDYTATMYDTPVSMAILGNFE